MPAATLITGITVEEEHLAEITKWTSETLESPACQSLPPSVHWGITLWNIAARREQDREAKLQMLQGGASYMLTLMEDWLRESGDDMGEGLRVSLSRWHSKLEDMAQDFEDAKGYEDEV